VCICGEAAATSLEWAAARESSSDKALIRRIAAGDQSAMRALFARYRVALYRWLLRLVDDRALAEGLLSEGFLVAWRQAASFAARSSVSTWLLVIARYRARRSGGRSASCPRGPPDQLRLTEAFPALIRRHMDRIARMALLSVSGRIRNRTRRSKAPHSVPSPLTGRPI